MSPTTTWSDALDAFEAALIDLGGSTGPEGGSVPTFDFAFDALAGPVPDTLVPRARHLLTLAHSVQSQVSTAMNGLDAQRALVTRMVPQGATGRPRYVDTAG